METKGLMQPMRLKKKMTAPLMTRASIAMSELWLILAKLVGGEKFVVKRVFLEVQRGD